MANRLLHFFLLAFAIIFATVAADNDTTKSKEVFKCVRRTTGIDYCPLGRLQSGECPWDDDKIGTFRSRQDCIKSLEKCTFTYEDDVWRCEADPNGKARLKCRSKLQTDLVYCPKDYSLLSSCPFGDKPLRIYASYQGCVKSFKENCTLVDDGVPRCTVTVEEPAPEGVEEDNFDEADVDEENLRAKCKEEITGALYCMNSANCLSPNDEVQQLYESYELCVKSIGECVTIKDSRPERCVVTPAPEGADFPFFPAHDYRRTTTTRRPFWQTYGLCYSINGRRAYCTLDPCIPNANNFNNPNNCCTSRYRFSQSFVSVRACKQRLGGYCTDTIVGRLILQSRRVCLRTLY